MRFALLFASMVAFGSAQPERARDLNNTGLEAVASGDYAAGARALSEALAIWRSLGEAFTPHVAIELVNLGDAECAQGNWAEGRKLFAEAVDLSTKSSGPRDLRTLTDMNRLANADLILGEMASAEALYREALASERELYPNDLQTAHSLVGLSALHSKTRNFKDALPEAEEGLSITLRVLGENDPESGLAYANVGMILRVSGKVDRALPLLRKAAVIFERTLGPQHPRVGSVLSQEGLALMAEKKLTLAEQDLVRAVNVLTQSGADKVQLAVAEHNLALLRMRQKRYAEADSLFSRALSLEEQYSSRAGTEMAATLDLLSEVREKENRPEDAARLRERASTISSYR